MSVSCSATGAVAERPVVADGCPVADGVPAAMGSMIVSAPAGSSVSRGRSIPGTCGWLAKPGWSVRDIGVGSIKVASESCSAGDGACVGSGCPVGMMSPSQKSRPIGRGHQVYGPQGAQRTREAQRIWWQPWNRCIAGLSRAERDEGQSNAGESRIEFRCVSPQSESGLILTFARVSGTLFAVSCTCFRSLSCVDSVGIRG